MASLTIIGLLLFSGQSFAQMMFSGSDLGTGQPLYSGPASQLPLSAYRSQNPFLMGRSYQQPMMMDPRMQMQGYDVRGGNAGLYQSQFGGGYPVAMQRGMPMSMQQSPFQPSPFQQSPYPAPSPFASQIQSPFGGSPMSPDGYMSPNELPPMSAGGYPTQFMGNNGGRLMVSPAMGGVSFFPFARVRPGPGLVIISNQEGGEDESGEFPATNTSVADTVLAVNDAVQTFLNLTASQDGLSAAAVSVNGIISLMGGKNSTTTTTVAPTGSSTQQPCTHPVYMNRVFMSTALQMGLISANTSCVVLVDH